MEQPDKPTSELGAILDLQRMIAEELEDGLDEAIFSRSFMPLTNGLGLDSPVKKNGLLEENPPVAPPEEDVWEASRQTQLKQEASRAANDKPEAPRQTRQETYAPVATPAREERAFAAHAVAEEEEEPLVASKPPPPVPRPSFWRRAFAAFIDQMFVWALFLFSVLITLNIFGGTGNLFSLKGLEQVHNPAFLRLALMEFATLWLSYFAFGLGVLDMTFGMWVWGIRVGYGEEGAEQETRFLKKFIRVLGSFFFFAPIAPLLILTIRRRGRNLLDALSGTHLYRSMV